MRTLIVTLAAVMTWAAAATAAPPASRPATGQTLRLWPHRAPRATDDSDAQTPTLTLYPPAAGATPTGTAVVVYPGGGYAMLAGHEGKDVAEWLAAHGVFAAVCKYRVNVAAPAPMLDGQRAVRLVRDHAKAWGVDPRRVGVMGFSAGGHVASTVATHYDTGIPHTGDPVQDASCRPDFQILVYPVISMQDGVTHPGSRRILLGEKPNPKLVALYSNDGQVTPATPPAFVVASTPDTIVPVENSRRYVNGLRTHKVAVEYLELPTGNHGYGLAKNDPKLSVWTDRCLAWMRGRGLLTPATLAMPPKKAQP